MICLNRRVSAETGWTWNELCTPVTAKLKKNSSRLNSSGRFFRNFQILCKFVFVKPLPPCYAIIFFPTCDVNDMKIMVEFAAV